MAKQSKILQARRQRPPGAESLLTRSTESVGRVIGSLQRQLDRTARQLASAADDLVGTVQRKTGRAFNGSAAISKRKKKTASAAATSRNGSRGSQSGKAARKSSASTGARKTRGRKA